MKRLLFVTFLLFGFLEGICQYNLNTSYGYNESSDVFDYNTFKVGNYSFGWYRTSGSAEAMLSGHGGVSLFTGAQKRFNINSVGDTWLSRNLTLNGNQLIFNKSNSPNATIWLNNPTSGPASQGHYYIKAYDWWSAYLHFKGMGDNGDERLNVTVDGRLGIGTESPDPSHKMSIYSQKV
ncbi:hypothetical protein FUAX_53140 (plasmid) [Fulvitalea axinellae]|uniref:Uncharacterized protein n=1 Tax=Fulvitalea axinellae TaxID=1182444 RepID=A0AAU9CYN0_9BACT|nr:hypothetical protein FUAX_53140 [Fulvitalea axinellae]